MFKWCQSGRAVSPSAQKPRKVVVNHMVREDIFSKGHPNYSYAKNQIRTTKYTLLTFIPKNLFEQFHRFANIYFLFIQVLNWMPRISAFGKEIQLVPFLFVLGVTAVKDAYEDRRRNRSDKRVNNSLCRHYNSKANRFIKTKWQNLCVGDIVHLSCDETVPADILILRSSDPAGLCFVETANLDGENNLKQRQVIKGYAEKSRTFTPTDFKGTIECDPPNSQIYKFNGFITEPKGEKIVISKDNLLLRDCVLKNTDFIEGIVVYAGHETKAMLNNSGPRSKRSKLERTMNRDVIWCVLFLLLMCMSGAIGHGFWLSKYEQPDATLFLVIEPDEDFKPSETAFFVFWTFVILYQVMIPLSLYVTIELIKLGQIYHIHDDKKMHDEDTQKKVFCRALNITEDLGQIEYIFSDKTGTLTENHMVFRRCSIGGIDYGHEKVNIGESNTSEEEQEEFRLNKYLKEEITLMTQTMPSKESLPHYQLATQSQRVLDFLTLLAVCNTAMATKRPHKDQLSSSGRQLNRTSPSPSPVSRSRSMRESISNLFAVLPNPFSTPSPKKEMSRSPSPVPFKPIYESESPDEVALVTAAYRYGIKLLKRNADMVMVSMPEGVVRFKVLNILPFDSTRKKMSVILRHPQTNQIVLYCKGSDTAILESLAKTNDQEMNKIIDITVKQLGSYSRKGLRTLCMSKRTLTEEEYHKWNDLHKKAEESIENNEELLLQSHNRIEVNLELMGATGIEDSLQERVPEAIANLRMAGIVVWVLTGDKLETAVNIAYSCRLFTKNMEIIYLKIESENEAIDIINKHLDDMFKKGVVQMKTESRMPTAMDYLKRFLLFGTKVLDRGETVDTSVRSKRGIVIDGNTLTIVLKPEIIETFLDLTQYCSSVLVCRATPLQKSSVVLNVKEKLNVMTLAVGDGANDVAMIQTADVGIGISGQEGTQAVMASDFAIPRFLHLERLLLVHGNRSYFRLGRTVLYFFYKNATSVFIIFWFQIHCGFSGAVMIDQLYLMIVNALFTSFPPMILGIYDKDCPSRILIDKPNLYGRGRRGRIYTEYSFWVNMFDAFYQSFIMFYIPYIFFFDTTIGIWEFGTIVFSACILQNLVHIAISYKTWSALHVLAISFSIVSYFMFAYVYNILALNSLTSADAYMVIQNISYDSKFWFATILIIILSTIPRAVMRVSQNTLMPSSISKEVKLIKEWSAGDETEDFLNNIPFKRKAVSGVWTRKTSSAIMSKTGSANKLMKPQDSKDSEDPEEVTKDMKDTKPKTPNKVSKSPPKTGESVLKTPPKT